jgi:guanylate kinase
VEGPANAANRPGKLFVVSGPSGVGKGSVVRLLRDGDPTFGYSVSVTTRPPRAGEEHGSDYLFVSPEEFMDLLLEDAFLEHADVFGHRYGTILGPVEEARRTGRDVLLEIDVQGARTIRERIPDAVLVFLRPPSMDELERRLRARQTEDEALLQIRLAEAAQEMAQAAWFDHEVVNDDLEGAAAEVAAIIERYRSE